MLLPCLALLAGPFLVSAKHLRLPAPLDQEAPFTDLPPLRNVQIKQPTLLANRLPDQTIPLLQHTFANSFGKPAIARYQPPSDLSHQELVLELNVSSIGRQYDRLASLYLDHVEILRTSTAEPTANGIYWSVTKDVSHYAPLLRKPGPLLLDLGNLINKDVNLTGSFEVSLYLHTFKRPHHQPYTLPADVIIPLSNKLPDQANYFEVDGANFGETTVLVPKNAARVLLEIYASGNDQEEFWYTNAPDKLVQQMPPDAGLLGRGAYREVQVYVNGTLAGVVVPFPVIFTGGIIPTAWRPIAAYGAFDQPTYLIELSPFLPLLCAGPAKISLTVLGPEREKRHRTLPNWFVSGNLQITLGNDESTTTGKLVDYWVQPFAKTVGGSYVAKDKQTARANIEAMRSLRIVSHLNVSGQPITSTFEQELSFSNDQHYDDGGAFQSVKQDIKSLTKSNFGLLEDSHFPLSVTSNFSSAARSISAEITNGFRRRLELHGTTSTINTRQSAEGGIVLNAIGRVERGYGDTRQHFEYWDSEGRTHWRKVYAKDGQLLSDRQGGSMGAAREWTGWLAQ